MRKVFYTIAFASLALFSASCNKEAQDPIINVAENTTKLYATIVNEVATKSEAGSIEMTAFNPDEEVDGQLPTTKVTMKIEGGKAKFAWAENDEITVLTTNGATPKFTLTSWNGGDGVFTGDLGGSEMAGIAYYPYHKDHEANAVLLPNVYTYNPAVDAPINAVMKGELSENNKLTFKHVGALLCVKYSNLREEGFTEFKFSTDADITGRFNVTEGKIVKAIEYSSNTVTYEFAETTIGQDMTFYIPLPIQPYKTMTAELLKEDGTKFTKTLTNSSKDGVTPTLAHLINFPTIELDFLAKGDVYTVYKEEGLVKAFAAAASKGDAFTIILAADITVTSGTVLNIDTLNGTIDGDGYTISGLNQTLPLVSTLNASGKIMNLTIKDSNVQGTAEELGAFVGNNLGEINNCELYKGNVSGAKYYCGGIVGYSNADSKTVGCRVINSDINSESADCAVGGVIGGTAYDKRKQFYIAAFCLSKDNKIKEGDFCADIVGDLDKGANIYACYTFGTNIYDGDGTANACYDSSTGWTTAIAAMNEAYSSVYHFTWGAEEGTLTKN